MGKRIGRKWDLLPEGSGALWLLGACFVLGGVAGCLFAGYTDGAGAQALSGYLADYLRLAGEGTVLRNFPRVMWEQLRYLLAAILLGVTILGVVGLPILFAVRGFLFAFCVGCFFRVFGSPGLFPAFFLFGLPALLWAPAFFLTGSQGLSGTLDALRRGDRRGSNGSVAFWTRTAVSFLLTVLCGFLEYFSVPVMLRAAARVAL